MRIFFYLRSVIAAVVYPFAVSALAITTILGVMIIPGSTNKRHFGNFMAMAWGRVSCWLFGVRVRLLNEQNIPKGGCLFLFNHTSFVDVFAMHGYIRNLRFGAKIELFKIPFFGRAMRMIGVLPIARDNIKDVIRVYDEAKARAREGQKFALAPEGTRQPIEKLGSFKTGPFVFAINSQIPIVPVVIKGASASFPKGAVLPNTDRLMQEVTVDFLPMVSVEGVSYDKRHELQQKVHAMMAPYF